MHSEWEAYWDGYRYTDAVASKLSNAVGAPFGFQNTGGGCICLEARLEGGVYVLVGSAVDGPLVWHDGAAETYTGGYGVGVYAEGSGDTFANATDYGARTGSDVLALLQRALALVPRQTDTHYVNWERDADGVITETLWLK